MKNLDKLFFVYYCGPVKMDVRSSAILEKICPSRPSREGRQNRDLLWGGIGKFRYWGRMNHTELEDAILQMKGGNPHVKIWAYVLARSIAIYNLFFIIMVRNNGGLFAT
jgi:hypothetical protein